jgi:hypothetical protein
MGSKLQPFGINIDDYVAKFAMIDAYWDSSRNTNLSIWQIAGYYDFVTWIDDISVSIGRSIPPRVCTDFWSKEQRLGMDIGFSVRTWPISDRWDTLTPFRFYVGWGKSDLWGPFDGIPGPVKAHYYPEVTADLGILDGDGLPCSWLYPHIAMYFHTDGTIYLSVGNNSNVQKRHLIPGINWQTAVTVNGGAAVSPFPTIPVEIAYYPGVKIDCFFDDELVFSLPYDLVAFPSGDIVPDTSTGAAATYTNINYFLETSGFNAGDKNWYQLSDYYYFIKSVRSI